MLQWLRHTAAAFSALIIGSRTAKPNKATSEAPEVTDLLARYRACKFSHEKGREIQSIAERNNSAAEEALAVVLRDPDRACRWEALHGLAKFKSPRAHRLLATGLNDPDSGIRCHAIGLIEEAAFPGASALLIQSLRDEDAHARWCALTGLVEMKAHEAINEIQSLLRDSSDSVREASMDALILWMGKDATRLIRDMLGDHVDGIRWKAKSHLESMGQLPAPEELTDLARTLFDVDEFKKLGGPGGFFENVRRLPDLSQRQRMQEQTLAQCRRIAKNLHLTRLDDWRRAELLINVASFALGAGASLDEAFSIADQGYQQLPNDRDEYISAVHRHALAFFRLALARDFAAADALRGSVCQRGYRDEFRMGCDRLASLSAPLRQSISELLKGQSIPDSLRPYLSCS